MRSRSSTALYTPSYTIPTLRRVVAYVVIAAGVLLCAFLMAKGSPMRIAMAYAIVLAPAAIYAALTRPMLFPYALYVLLIPFDNLLRISSFGTLTKLLGILSGLALVFWCLRARRIEMPPRAVLALSALLSWALCSTFWAYSQKDVVAALPQYFSIALLYVAVTMTPITRADLRYLFAATVVGGVLAAAYGADQFYRNTAMMAQELVERRLIISSGDSFIDPNQFANALLFPVAILMMATLRTRWLVLKLLGLGGISLLTGAIVLSGSREGIVGLAAMIIYYFWRTRYRLQIAVIAAFGALASLVVQSSAWVRFSNLISMGDARGSIWSVGLEAFRHNWLVGYGMGNFMSVYDEYYLRVHQTYKYGYGWSAPAHNLVVQIAVELGVVGVLLLAWFVVTTFTDLRSIDRDGPLSDERIMMEGALLSLFIVSLFIGLFTYKYAWLVFTMAAQLRLIGLQERGRRRSARAYS